MIAQTQGPLALISGAVYSFGLLFLFGVSAIYHRPYWDPKPRAMLGRLDHSAIFILIAGTFTPVCLLGMPKASGDQLLILIWSAAVLGSLQSIFWVTAPKWLNGIVYVCVGWLVIPYMGELRESLGRDGFLLILFGGIAYTVGAVFYVLKKPNLRPGVFGYHELFHVMTIIGAALQFIPIYRLIMAAT